MGSRYQNIAVKEKVWGFIDTVVWISVLVGGVFMQFLKGLGALPTSGGGVSIKRTLNETVAQIPSEILWYNYLGFAVVIFIIYTFCRLIDAKWLSKGGGNLFYPVLYSTASLVSYFGLVFFSARAT